MNSEETIMDSFAGTTFDLHLEEKVKGKEALRQRKMKGQSPKSELYVFTCLNFYTKAIIYTWKKIQMIQVDMR